MVDHVKCYRCAGGWKDGRCRQAAGSADNKAMEDGSSADGRSSMQRARRRRAGGCKGRDGQEESRSKC